MADWEGFRGELEGAPTRQPPLHALRERRARRMRRRAAAGTFAVVLMATATGVAILREEDRGSGPVVAAGEQIELNRIVNGKQVAPPKDYKDYVVTDVDFVDEATGWAIGLRCVGDGCDVATWRTDDGGETWAAPTTVAANVPRTSFHDEDPSGGGARSLRMVDETTGYAFNPDLYVTRDGARTWTRMPRESKVASVSVEASNVWVTERGCAKDADCDVVVHTGTAGGPLSELLDVPGTNAAPALLRRASRNEAYLVTWDAPQDPRASLHVTTDGRTWTERLMPCADATAVLMTVAPGAQVMLVCTTDVTRTAYVSGDQARTWQRLPDPPVDGVVTDLVGIAGRGAYLTTQEPGALWVLDGPAWRKADVGRAYGYANVDPTGPGTAVVMGDAGQYWRLRDGRWSRHALPPRAVRVAPAGLPRNGRHWTSLSFLDERRGWAMGYHCTASACDSTLMRTNDGGNTWEPAPGPQLQWPISPTYFAWRAGKVVFADERNGFAYGHGMFATHDGGERWTRIRLGPSVEHVAVREGIVWAVAGERVYRGPVDADAMTPTPAQPGAGVAGALVVVDARTAYVVGPRKVAGTTDGGATWSAHDPPCPSARASSWASGSLWLVCAAASPAAPQTQAVSSDGGRTWRTSRLPGTGSALGEIVALSSTDAWRTGANAGLLGTRDGGATWTAVPNVAGHASGLTFAGPRYGFLIADDVLYRTVDGGLTWRHVGR